MNKKYLEINNIADEASYALVNAYLNDLILEATNCGALAEPDADNEYTQEIGRISSMCGIYESKQLQFKHIKVKSPLVLSIEEEMHTRKLKQRQMAELLEVKESTFSQILSGHRAISMKMAKRLYKILNIDPKLILEFS